MPVTVIVGAQWGDEGKGKIVDLLSRHADIVARYQGGANAGHTVVSNKVKTILHLIPSGILNPDCVCILGSGMVIDPVQLLNEIDYLGSMGVDITNRLFISHQAHLIMPYHKKLDELTERFRGNNAIGVTGRGIGPAYTDKYMRIGIRIVDLLDRELLISKLEHAIEFNNRFIHEIHGEPELNRDEIIDYYLNFDRRIDPMITDVSEYLNEAIYQNKRIICESAQGTLLDVDWGTYPFVTSSNPTAGGAITGLGIGPTKIDKVIGVIKAYITRVGTGPFPTEFDDEMNNRMRSAGDEYGATTGRARRCGWFDAVIARYAARINGIEQWALTKLDVLSGFEEIKICVEYSYEDRRIINFPAEHKVINNLTPIYETYPGWNVPISDVRKFNDLPIEAKNYIKRIEELSNTPIKILSVGSDREETILV